MKFRSHLAVATSVTIGCAYKTTNTRISQKENYPKAYLTMKTQSHKIKSVVSIYPNNKC